MMELQYAALPLYTPSEPLPKYSCQPSCNENTLQHSPLRVRTIPTGTYTRRSGKITVTLFEQEDGVDMPVYHRCNHISGLLLIECPEKVTRVTMKIQGKLKTITSQTGSKSIQLINVFHTLWRKGESEELSSCFPFSYLLPNTFIHEGAEHPLPPTFRIDQTSTPFLRVLYSINICVSSTRHNMEFLTKSDNVKIFFKYYPRSRPHRPILPSPHFFSTVKTSPEEWYQASSALKTRKLKPEFGPIYCHLFIPSARVYGLADRIPFHVQLNGPLDALQQFLMPQLVNVSMPSTMQNPHGTCPQRIKPLVVVSLVRQSKTKTRGSKFQKNQTIGQGEVQELPPLICESRDAIHLDWGGEIQVNEDVEVGGFVAGNVSVRDFISLVLEPPAANDQACPYLCLRMSVPIRLVTDSYVEVIDYEPPLE
ncbi:hypothetical protein E4T56_gene15672 [Termitomyces sp. T112]|nr:hypothetical protein E4T56_gene15672 [Termitomyces sp. T112]